MLALPLLAADPWPASYVLQDLGPKPDTQNAYSLTFNMPLLNRQLSAQVLGPDYRPLLTRRLFYPAIAGFVGLGISQDAFNVYGQSTGTSLTTIGNPHAFYWNGVKLRDLGTLGGAYSYGNSINDTNHITGGAHTSTGQLHAFIWYGTMQDLGTLGGNESYGLSINAVGQVTGASLNVVGLQHAFFWNGATMRDLGTLGGIFSVGRSINTFGEVVGTSGIFNFDNPTHAFLWTRSTMIDLNDAVINRGGWTLTAALSINDSSQILGLGLLNGEERVFLLIPTTARPLFQ